MFKIFNKKDTRNLTLDEKEAIIDSYLRQARDICDNYTYHHNNYKRGGKDQLDELIAKLTFMSERIENIETLELIEEKTKWEKLFNLGK